MRAAHPLPVDQGALTATRGAGSLYARVMGESWFQLAEPIRDLHSSESTTCARGFLRVEHGGHRLARVIARALRLPPACPATCTELSVLALDGGEHWQRTFAATPVTTHQWLRGRELVERYGALEFRFRLRASGERLVYLQREVALQIMGFRLRLPGYLAPHVFALEEAVAPGRVHVSVKVTLPVIGVLIAYGGTIDVAET